MSIPKTWKGVVGVYSACPKEVQSYFEYFPDLAEDYPWEVALSYLFGRVELAHNMAIYCGIVKLHKGNAELTRKAVESHHLTRDGFRTFFAAIYGKPIDAKISQLIEEAEAIRDKVLHGKSASQEELRRSVVRVLEYAVQFNAFVHAIAGIKPFNDLRGFKGRAVSHDKSTTRWLLKGMGLPLS